MTDRLRTERKIGRDREGDRQKDKHADLLPTTPDTALGLHESVSSCVFPCWFGLIPIQKLLDTDAESQGGGGGTHRRTDAHKHSHTLAKTGSKLFHQSLAQHGERCLKRDWLRSQWGSMLESFEPCFHGDGSRHVLRRRDVFE